MILIYSLIFCVECKVGGLRYSSGHMSDRINIVLPIPSQLYSIIIGLLLGLQANAINKVGVWKELAFELEKFNIHIAGVQEMWSKWVSQFNVKDFWIYHSLAVKGKVELHS